MKVENYLSNIVKYIELFLKDHDKIVIAIDGMCGSGKTTLAQEINSFFNGNIIHMDDYFLPLEKRTEERLSTPGGNVNYEKVYEDIVLNLDKDLIYEPFVCKTKSFKEKSIIKFNKVTIIEGSYALHPYFKKYYDLAIVLKISDTKQIERLSKREGLKLDDFINKWIPLENKYFEYYDIFSKADFLIDIK